MNTLTLLFHLPVFILTFSAYLLLANFKKQKYQSSFLKIALNIVYYIILLVLLLELIFWFILPAYNYVS